MGRREQTALIIAEAALTTLTALAKANRLGEKSKKISVAADALLAAIRSVDEATAVNT